MVNLLSKLKYRFDLGFSVLSLFIYLLQVNSNKAEISTILGISTKLVLLLAIPFGLFCVILFGCFLIWLKFPQKYNTEANLRNEQIEEILYMLRKQEGLKPRRADVGSPKHAVKLYPVERDFYESQRVS